MSEASWWVTQQVGSNVEEATEPLLNTHSTRAGCELVSHMVQVLCEANPNTTVSTQHRGRP